MLFGLHQVSAGSTWPIFIYTGSYNSIDKSARISRPSFMAKSVTLAFSFQAQQNPMGQFD